MLTSHYKWNFNFVSFYIYICSKFVNALLCKFTDSFHKRYSNKQFGMKVLNECLINFKWKQIVTLADVKLVLLRYLNQTIRDGGFEFCLYEIITF